MPDRCTILSALREELEPRADVRSFAEGGSAAFGRLDELSDIDIICDVTKGAEAEVFTAVEDCLSQLGTLAYRWDAGDAAHPGYAQRFYRLAQSPPQLYIDILLRNTVPPAFTELEQHGRPIVHFDKDGLTAPTAVGADFFARMEQRRAAIAGSLPLYADLVRKELKRGDGAAAQAFFHSLMRMLVELLRMRACPARYTFGLRYLRADLGPADAQRVEQLLFNADSAALAASAEKTVEWATALLAEQCSTESGRSA